MSPSEVYVGGLDGPIRERRWRFEVLDGPDAGTCFVPARHPALLGVAPAADFASAMTPSPDFTPSWTSKPTS